MASLAEIQTILEQIKNDLPLLINRSQIAPKQVVIVNGLSDMSERLGLVQAGEFRVGNGKEPGYGFSGVRMGYPPFSYLSQTWNLAGVHNDILQFGLDATQGKAYFAAGTAILDFAGATFQAQNGTSYFLQWKTNDNQTLVGKIGAFYVGTDSGIEVVGQQKTSGFVGVAHLMTTDVNGVFVNSLEIRTDGDTQLDLRTSLSDGVGSQRQRILANKNITNVVSPMLQLEMNVKGTAANGLGVSIPIYIENASGVLKEIGRISWIYTDVVNGTEDSKVTVHYMLNGVLTEKQIAP